MEFKCINCNGEEFFQTKTWTSGDGIGFDTRICKECGCIRWFADAPTIQRIIKREQVDLEYGKTIEDYQAKKANIEKEIEELQQVVNDDGQTVRVANEAKERLGQLQMQLRDMRRPPQKPLVY